VKRIEVAPPRVKVSGKSEQVAGFNVLETEPVDLQGIQQTQTFSTRLKLPVGVRATPEFVEVRVVVIPRPDAAPPETVPKGPTPSSFDGP
jgi:YbbR domain-containing protein